MTDLMLSTLQQMVKASRRNLSIYRAETVAELMLAVENTYYDIYLIDEPMERAWSYFSFVDGKIMAHKMEIASDLDEDERNTPFSINTPMQDSGVVEEVDGNTPITVICYPEDTVLTVFNYE